MRRKLINDYLREIQQDYKNLGYDMDKIRRYEEYHLGKFLMDALFFNVSIESLSNFIKSGIMDINMRQSIDEAVKLLKLKNIKVEVELGKEKLMKELKKKVDELSDSIFVKNYKE